MTAETSLHNSLFSNWLRDDSKIVLTFAPEILQSGAVTPQNMRIRILRSSVVCAFATASAPAAGTFYTDESQFVLAIGPVRSVEDFSSFTFGSPLDGTQLTYDAPGDNGFDWTAFSATGLYSNTSALSVSVGNTSITIGFTGDTVTAIGGIFADTDVDGNSIPGMVTVTTSDGSMQTIATTTDGFLGYVSDTPIVSITMIATGDAPNNFIQVDHFYTAIAIPEPATVSLTLVGLGVLALVARRRRRAEL